MKMFKNPFILAFIFGALALTMIRQFSYLRESAPPPLVEVGEWSLKDQAGHDFGSQALKGKVYIADFFFTRCPSICPHLTHSMQEVQKRYLGKKKPIHFLSITVDPSHDSADRLLEYASKKKLDLSNWSFLTGTQGELEQVIVQQMKIHMGDKKAIPKSDNLYDISHMAQLALFDQQGDLRGLFQTDPTGLANLVRAANLLIRQG